MKIKIEVDENTKEDEIILRCKNFDNRFIEIQKALEDILNKKNKIVFYKEEIEYYFSIENIIFFETEKNIINAHTKDDIYNVKYKLYELEDILPSQFVRISKSTILNINHIYSISRNLTSASLVQFKNTYKQVYVSRHYYKILKLKLSERR